MFSKFTNLFFPVCSFVVYLTIFCAYFSKAKIESQETKIYSKLIITGLLESGLYSFICLIAHFVDIDSNFTFYSIFNKIIYSVYIIWFSFLLQYIISIYNLHHEKTNLKKKINGLIIIADIIWITIIFITNVQIFFDKTIGQSNSYGDSANILFLAISIYVLAMSVMAFLDLKNGNNKSKKYIPFYLLLILMVIALIIRAVDPLFNIYSNVLSLVVLVMYFTIENPDVKMAKELAFQKELAEVSANNTMVLLEDMSKDLNTSLEQLEKFGNKKFNTNNLYKFNQELADFQESSIKLKEKITNIIELATVKNKIEVKEKKYETYDMLDNLKQLIKADNKINRTIVNINNKMPTVLYGDDDSIVKMVLYFLNFIQSLTKNKELKLYISSLQVGRFSRLKFKFVVNDDNIKKYIELDKDNEKLVLSNKDSIELQIVRRILNNFNGKMTIIENGKDTLIELSIDQRLLTEYEIISKRDENKNINIQYHDYRGKRILIVDNNNFAIKELKTLLKPYNVDVTSANSPSQMNEIISHNKTFDIIFIDDIIPRFNIDDFTNELVRTKEDILNKITNEAKYSIVTVIMVNQNTIHQEKEYLACGFNDYIIKPINKKNLNTLLNKYFLKNK